MNAGRIIAYIVAAVLIFFGVLFIWGAFSPNGSAGWILIGLIPVGITFAMVYFASRKSAKAGSDAAQVTYKIDLPANVEMDTLKCKACGGVLGPENIQMIAGAPVVTCPYCKTTYQLTEEPKW